MRKIIFIMSLCLISIGTFAQSSVGPYVQLVKGLPGAYQARVALAVTNVKEREIPSLVLCLTNFTNYDVYDDESRILVKFDDDSKMTLKRLPFDETIKKYDNVVLSGMVYEHFNTFTTYLVDEEFLAKLLQHNIIKVRIVMSNGNVKEYEIKSNYQSTLAQELRQSYASAKKKNKERMENMNDDNF